MWIRLIIFCIFILAVIKAQDTTTIDDKNPKKALYLSLIPGMGQAYNGKWLKSALILGLEYAAYSSWQTNKMKYDNYDQNDYPLPRHRYLEKRNKYVWWMGFIYVYAMIDAVVDAHLHSFDDQMKSPLQEKNKIRS